MNRTFWRGKKVFLTGHTGFKGSWLSLWLQELGADVAGYSLQPPTTPNLFELAGVAEGMTSLLGDVRDLDALQSAMSRQQPHLIAQRWRLEASQSTMSRMSPSSQNCRALSIWRLRSTALLSPAWTRQSF